MALITCPECNHEISNRAENCPHCGYPISKDEKLKSYSFSIAIYKIKDTPRIKLDKINELLQTVLGYTKEETEKLEEIGYSRNIYDYLTTDITLEQAKSIAIPFNDWGIRTFLKNDEQEWIRWESVGGLPPQNPKDHYYDEPIVTRDHLMDPFNPPQVERKPVATTSVAVDNYVKCPYCKSTKTRKISTASRVVSTGLFGLGSKKIGKQWHCNTCNSDF